MYLYIHYIYMYLDWYIYVGMHIWIDPLVIYPLVHLALCICLCKCMHMCTCKRICVFQYGSVKVHHVGIWTCTCTCKNVNTCRCGYMYLSMCTWVHGYGESLQGEDRFICIHVHMNISCVCTFVRIYICVYKCIHPLICMRIHTYAWVELYVCMCVCVCA